MLRCAVIGHTTSGDGARPMRSNEVVKTAIRDRDSMEDGRIESSREY